MAGDHPDVPFLQAEHYAKGRPDGPPLWIVWHTTEEDELADTAERVARFFAYNTGDRTVSSHYVADVDSVIQCVRLGDVAYTVGNRAGNYRGINIELAGRASQSAGQWADAYSQAMLRRICVIVARDMARYSIPNRWCTVTDLQARRPGHTTHNDLRLAFGGTTHTDPGAGFPRSQVLALVSGQEDDVSAAEVFAYKIGSKWLADKGIALGEGQPFSEWVKALGILLYNDQLLRAELAAMEAREVARDAAQTTLIRAVTAGQISDEAVAQLAATVADAAAAAGADTRDRVLAELARQEAEREAALRAALAAETGS